jgi:hypothetical protein
MSITENDKYVLNAIFNPNYPLDFEKELPSNSTNLENESKLSYNSCNHVYFLLRTIVRNKKIRKRRYIQNLHLVYYLILFRSTIS